MERFEVADHSDSRPACGRFPRSWHNHLRPADRQSGRLGRTPFLNNVIPADRLSRVAQQLNSWLPDPSNQTFSSNYFASGSSVFDRNAIDTKVNWNKSDKLTAFGRFSILNFTDWAPTPFDQASGGAIDTSQQAGFGKAARSVRRLARITL